MASLVLGVAGAAIGPSLFGETAFTLFGTAITGASLGGTLGSLAGGLIDSALLPGLTTQKVTGPRLTDLNIQTSTEGAVIPRIDGYMRVSGQIIWATQFKETTNTTKTGGKGSTPSTQSTTYTYSISFAVGLCEGEVHKLGRIWADGNLIDSSKYTLRFYIGSEDQDPDPLIEEIEGSGNTPAYRGLCYVVFEDMDLTAFGNRIPQLQFELVRAISADKPGSVENMLAGVNLIPGAGEFVYSTDEVTSDDGSGLGVSSVQNENNTSGVPDATASLDDLAAVAPNIQVVALTAGWFGDDLRAGSCLIKPRVETSVRNTYPSPWVVNGVDRSHAVLVSQIDGRPAYGGTPSDNTIVEMIQDLRDNRGYRVNFYPFLFMDIPTGNSLPNPYSNGAATNGQPAYPWRGRITCSPAAGYTSTVDKTSTAGTQISAFFGSASASDFSVSGTAVSWTGGTDWGYRRMILHYAKLCVAAGGVDAFLIGSELRGITRTRSASTTYPGVAALKTLAADVKAIFTAASMSTKVGYAADWSEYNNHQTGDAAGAVQFNLDPLWSDSHIDFIGIDNYMPLADWRDGTAHLDYDPVNGPTTLYDRAYLQSNIKGGEDYDWYYASDADRASQTRTTITDGAGKPWVFRQKDLWNWWSNAHYDRVSGTESGTPTGWTAQSKPIWFTEIGCPAIDKGPNQPNVFYDPKSSESFFPYFSNGQRDDLAQRYFLEAHLNYWADSANNPTSTVYSAPMVDTGNILVWTWDARPFPFFPQRSDLWGDAPNYELGHWLNGRLGAVMLADLVAEICEYAGFTDYDVSNLAGLVTGYAITDTMSVRDALLPLSTAYFFDAAESDGLIKFIMRGQATTTSLTEDDMVIDLSSDPSSGFNLTRAQEDDLPVESRITFIDPDNSYQQSSVDSRRLVGRSDRVAASQLPIVMDRAQAQGIGDTLIQDAWASRESASFGVAPSLLALDATDEVSVTVGGRTRRMRLTQINDAGARSCTAVASDPSIYDRFVGPARTIDKTTLPTSSGRAFLIFLDVPCLTEAQLSDAYNPLVAAYADPWPGAVYLYKSSTGSDYALDTIISTPANFGVLMYDFYQGPPWHWDRVNELYVELNTGTLETHTEIEVYQGANALAIQNPDGEWEIVQFRDAELIGPNQYKLTTFLRGRRGSEQQMRNPCPAGARVVVLDENIYQLDMEKASSGSPWYWKWGPRDRDLSSSAYQSTQLTFERVGLKPFAPCHIGFSYCLAGPDTGADGLMVNPDMMIWWIRRDRDPAARNIALPVTPMSEGSERYQIEILDGSSVKRSEDGVTIPDSGDPASHEASGSFRYTKAMQDEDWPSGMPNPLVVRVYQLSEVIGRGYGRTESIYWQ